MTTFEKVHDINPFTADETHAVYVVRTSTGRCFDVVGSYADAIRAQDRYADVTGYCDTTVHPEQTPVSIY